MKVGELRELLEAVEDDSLEVYIGTQPSWPLCFGVAGVRHPNEEREVECPVHEGYLVNHQFRNPTTNLYEHCGAEPEEEEDEDGSDRNAVWIVSSDGHPWDRSPYAPRWLWEGE